MAAEKKLASATKMILVVCQDEAKKELPWSSRVTVRELAKRYRIRQSEVIDIIEDSESLDTIVGGRCYAGFFGYNRPGDYHVEYIGE